MPVSRQDFTQLPHRPGELIPDEEITATWQGKSWRRTGGCHTKCGVCCEVIILPLDRRLLRSAAYWEKFKHYLEVRGLQVVVSPTRFEVRFPITCQHLQDDKSCGIFGTPERPELCNRWPRMPYDLFETGLDEACTYQWKEEEGHDE